MRSKLAGPEGLGPPPSIAGRSRTYMFRQLAGATAPFRPKRPLRHVAGATPYGLNQHGEPVDALAHVSVTQGQVDLQPSRKQRHDARSSWLSIASEGALASAICTVTNIGAAHSSCFQRNSTRAAIA